MLVRSLAHVFEGRPVDPKMWAKMNEGLKAKNIPVLPHHLSLPSSYDKLPQLVLNPINSTNSFVTWAINYFTNGFKLALPVYIPVYALPLLLFLPYKGLTATKLLSSLRRAGFGVVRSSTFLSMYTSIGLASILFMRAMGLRYLYLGRFAHLVIAVAGAVAGALSTLIEKKGRRIELALYVLSKSLESTWSLVKGGAARRGINLSIKDGEVVVFCGSFAVLGHVFMRHPDMLRRTYLAIMQRFLDNEQRHRFIK